MWIEKKTQVLNGNWTFSDCKRTMFFQLHWWYTAAFMWHLNIRCIDWFFVKERALSNQTHWSVKGKHVQLLINNIKNMSDSLMYRNACHWISGHIHLNFFNLVYNVYLCVAIIDNNHVIGAKIRDPSIRQTTEAT